MTAADRLAAIRAREQAATPGPWTVNEYAGVVVEHHDEQDGHVWGMTTVCGIGADDPDADFIAHARDDVRRMADALDAVLALCDARIATGRGWIDVADVEAAITAHLPATPTMEEDR